MADKYNIIVQSMLAAEFGLVVIESDAEFMKQLALRINDLIENDFTRLISILYRIDVKESKVKETLQLNSEVNAGSLIAKLIVERQLEKIKARENFVNRPPETDDEKW